MASPPALVSLPSAVLSVIASHIAASPPPCPHSLHFASLRKLHHTLPNDLLQPALAHPTLTAAVVDLLGPCSALLSPRVAGALLPEWVRALAAQVRGVSVADTTVTCADYRMRNYDSQAATDKIAVEDACCNALRLFQGLARSPVKLRVLDLQGVAFAHSSERACKDLEESLVGALQAAAPHLAQLATRADKVCVRAVRRVVMPSLEVVGITPGQEGHAEGLNAMEAHASVREVWFEGMALGDDALSGAAGAHILGQVERVRVWTSRNCSMTVVERFFKCLPRVKAVHWYGRLDEANVRALLRGCPKLQEIHIWLWDQFEQRWGCELRDEATDAAGVVTLTRGKLRVFASTVPLTTKLGEALVRGGMELRHLALELPPDCLASLVMVMQRCRKIRRLDLQYAQSEVLAPDAYTQTMLGVQGWQQLVDAVAAASDELRVFVLQYPDEHGPAEHDEVAMIDAMCRMFETLGDRARRVEFRIPIFVDDYGVLVPILTRLLNVVSAHNGNLEELRLFFVQCDVDWAWHNASERLPRIASLGEAIQKVRRKAKKLYVLDLDQVEIDARQDPEAEEED